jgi:hypothetical protein
MSIFLRNITLALVCLVAATQLPIPPFELRADTGKGINEAGLAFEKLSVSDGKWNLPIKLVTEPRCFFGDRDAIGLELIRSENPETELLLTIEPLPKGGETKKPTVAYIKNAAKDLEKGFDVILTVPRSAHKEILGLYICKDSNKEGSCRNKEIRTIPAVLNQYDSMQGVLTPDFVATDKIYFFKPIFFEGSGMRYPSAAMSSQRYAQLEQFINSEFGLNEGSKNAVTQIIEIGNTLQSRPLQMVDKKLIVRLPGYAPTRCRGAGTPAPPEVEQKK